MRLNVFAPSDRGRIAAMAVTAALSLPLLPAVAAAAPLGDVSALEPTAPAVPLEPAQEVGDGIGLLATSTAPIYDYEVYYLDGLGDTWYNSGSIMRYLYIRTDNPAADFVLELEGSEQNNVAGLQRNSFKDVEDTGWSSNCLRVPGGYIAGFAFKTDATGPQTLRLYEQDWNNYGIVTRKALAATFTANFVDYDEAVNKWADDAIARYTTSSMDPLEKMKAVSNGLRGEFRYLLNDGTYLINLVSQPANPFFVSKHWDSATSPAALCIVASRIGGFSDIHNCYSDYPRNSEEWVQFHAMCRVTYNGETRYYEACPMSETGKIDPSSIEKIDFNSLSSPAFDVPQGFEQAGSQAAQPVEHKISVDSPNGTVSISGGTSAATGEGISLTITPSEGYEVSSVSVTTADGRSVAVSGSGVTRTFTMPDADVKISVAFVREAAYRVRVNRPEHSTIYYQDREYAPGEEVYYMIDPDEGYGVSSIRAVDGTGRAVALDGPYSFPDGLRYVFTMPESDVTITATVAKDGAAQPIAVEASHCSVLAPKEAKPGVEVNLHVSADSGYGLKEDALTVVDGSGAAIAVTNLGAGGYAFTMPDGPVTVRCSATLGYAAGEHRVSKSSSANGRVDVDRTEAAPGETVTVTLTPDEGYLVEGPEIRAAGGGTVPATSAGTNRWTFAMPDDDVTVGATFKKDDGSEVPDYPVQLFDDVTDDAWYYGSVAWAVDNDVMHGYEGTSHFGPGDTISRAQMAMVLYNVAGNPDVDSTVMGRFDDCKAGIWYEDAVSWAVQQGIFSGYGDGGFGPDDPITREQIAAVLWRRAGEPSGSGDLSRFPDGAETSPWALDAMTWAVQQGIFSGSATTGELMPTGNLTRAEAATVMMRALS